MTNECSEAAAWNGAARISCEILFKCPKQRDRLQPTAVAGVRHCSACDRDVHLALTEENFRRHTDDRYCVAVRVLRPVRSLDALKKYVGGNVGVAHNGHLRPL